MATPKLCSAENCRNPVLARGLCDKHYRMDLAHRNELNAPQCSADGCNKLAQASRKGLCGTHYHQQRMQKRSLSAAPCSVPDCNKFIVNARGYCSAHYQRWQDHGDPLGGSTFKGEPLRWLMEHWDSDVGIDDPCIIWPYSRSPHGYADVWFNGKLVKATRIICEHVNGPPATPDAEAAHLCGRGHEACITPSHLAWKSHTDNQADRIVHGTTNRGERSAMAKLTIREVIEIRRLLKFMKQQDIADIYGVTRETISAIKCRKSWAWLV